VPYFILRIANEPADYSAFMATSVHEWRPAWFAQPERFGPSRGPVIWAFEQIWIWRLRVVSVLLLLGLLGTLGQRGLLLIALVALAMIASLTLLLAPVDRYMLLIEPLMWLVGWGGLCNLAGSARQYLPLRPQMKHSQ
jgi:hypothetical protein